LFLEGSPVFSLLRTRTGVGLVAPPLLLLSTPGRNGPFDSLHKHFFLPGVFSFYASSARYRVGVLPLLLLGQGHAIKDFFLTVEMADRTLASFSFASFAPSNYALGLRCMHSSILPHPFVCEMTSVVRLMLAAARSGGTFSSPDPSRR